MNIGALSTAVLIGVVLSYSGLPCVIAGIILLGTAYALGNVSLGVIGGVVGVFGAVVTFFTWRK